MSARTLTITAQADWKGALRHASQGVREREHQGEWLNFESPAAFFGELTERRWTLVCALQGRGEIPVRELARLLARDVERVHADVQKLLELGLLERGKDDCVVCPFTVVHIDIELRAARA
jgi:predicted transcriptional regulator